MYLKHCLLLVCMFHCINSQYEDFDVNNVLPGKKYYSKLRNGSNRLSVYCYPGTSKHILRFWQTVRLRLEIEGEDWDLYIGGTSDEVLDEHKAKRSIWSFNLPFKRKSDTLYLDPFNSTCVGVYTTKDHSVSIHILRIDFWLVFMFIGGLVLFFLAPRLSGNPIFYYSCGISVGVTMSFLIVIYITSRLIPKRSTLFAVVASGWAIGVYLINLIFTNLRTIALLYQHYVLAYVSISAFISFAICYRYGPVSNPRTISLIRWFLKSFGMGLMFYSSSFGEAAMAVIILLLIYDNFPKSVIFAVSRFWHSKFPAKVKLLSEDEYHEQGARETVKALDELRQYCSSPECNQWKTVLKLKRPIRFAEFVEGQSHLCDDELLQYESDISKHTLLTDDDSDSER